MCFCQRPGGPIQVICIHFFTIASLMGGRAPDQGPMIIAQVIHVERSVTPVIFRNFSKVDCVFFLKGVPQGGQVCLPAAKRAVFFLVSAERFPAYPKTGTR